MGIRQVLREETINLNLQADNKETVIEEMIDMLVSAGIIEAADKLEFEEIIWNRERQNSTGIGEGVAIPHGMSSIVKKPAVVFGRSEAGIDFDSIDKSKSHLFFMIATPDSSDEAHLKILSDLSTQLLDLEVKQALFGAQTDEDVFNAFLETQSNKNEEIIAQDAPLIVGVTGCATGIAHTYMAADRLKQTAENKGFRIKVETNGSSGVENRLRTEEIAEAIGVIVASDIKVDMHRFDGKKIVKAPVAHAISKSDELIAELLEDDVEVYRSQDKQVETNQKSQGAKGLYQHLMNGVSHMLPFVIGGGIMIALAFMIDQIMGVPTESLDQLGQYNALAGYFNTIGGTAFGFMLPVLAGYIAMSIADRPGLLLGFVAGGIANTGGAGFLGALLGGFIAGYMANLIKDMLKNMPDSLSGIKTILLYPIIGLLLVGFIMLLINVPMSIINEALNNFLEGLTGTNAVLLGAILGAMMAIDLGGPINKAAYVFGTGTLAATTTTGGSSVMAGVMAGGMVPPLAIFFATRLFKNRFTQEEREAGITNLVLGASFITEGAIPFAAADPVRMISSFVVGSAIASAAILGLGIKVLAPHGGIFVIFLVSNPFLYLLIILIGALISALMIGALKDPIE